MNCPKCGEECDRDSVNVGVGVMYGPWGCYACGWSEFDRQQAEREHPGYYCDPTGGLHKISAIVENAERFGLGEAATEAFRDCGQPSPQEQLPMFNVPEEKADELRRWVAVQDYETARMQGDDKPNYGASGGQLTYLFTPTSLGTVVKVRHNVTGEEIDLTDYSGW